MIGTLKGLQRQRGAARAFQTEGKAGVGTSLESWGDGEELVLRRYHGRNALAHFLPSTSSF